MSHNSKVSDSRMLAENGALYGQTASPLVLCRAMSPLVPRSRTQQADLSVKEQHLRILLVYPRYPDTFWSFRHALKFIAKKAAYPPLGLLTVASPAAGMGEEARRHERR